MEDFTWEELNETIDSLIEMGVLGENDEGVFLKQPVVIQVID